MGSDALMAEIRSHVLLPKFILQRFTNADNFFFVYDPVANVIKRSGPKQFNVERGYYAPDFERYLNKNIESAFSSTLCKIEIFLRERADAVFIKRNTIMEYFYSLFGRSPDLHRHLTEDPFLSLVYSQQELHCLATEGGMQEAKRDFKDMHSDIAIINNTTTIDFVLPASGICAFPSDEQESYYLILSPKLAIRICSPGEDRVAVGRMSADNIMCINRVSIQHEKLKKGKIIVANKNLLNELRRKQYC